MRLSNRLLRSANSALSEALAGNGFAGVPLLMPKLEASIGEEADMEDDIVTIDDRSDGSDGEEIACKSDGSDASTLTGVNGDDSLSASCVDEADDVDGDLYADGM